MTSTKPLSPPSDPDARAFCSGPRGPYCNGLRGRYREYMHEGGGLGVTREIVHESERLAAGTVLFVLKGRPKTQPMVMNYCPFCGTRISPHSSDTGEEMLLRSIQKASNGAVVVLALVRDQFTAWVAEALPENRVISSYRDARRALRELQAHFTTGSGAPKTPTDTPEDSNA